MYDSILNIAWRIMALKMAGSGKGEEKIAGSEIVCPEIIDSEIVGTEIAAQKLLAPK